MTQEYLLSKFNYCEHTGNLFNKNGKIAGWIDGNLPNGGYRRIKINNKCFYIHRIIWLMCTGKHVPINMEIDHKDNNRQNNKITNLRLATRNNNCWNYSIQFVNTTGIKGVSYIKNKGYYRARIKFKGTRIDLGCFRTLEQAGNAYEEAAFRLFGEFAKS